MLPTAARLQQRNAFHRRGERHGASRCRRETVGRVVALHKLFAARDVRLSRRGEASERSWAGQRAPEGIPPG